MIVLPMLRKCPSVAALGVATALFCGSCAKAKNFSTMPRKDALQLCLDSAQTQQERSLCIQSLLMSEDYTYQLFPHMVVDEKELDLWASCLDAALLTQVRMRKHLIRQIIAIIERDRNKTRQSVRELGLSLVPNSKAYRADSSPLYGEIDVDVLYSELEEECSRLDSYGK